MSGSVGDRPRGAGDATPVEEARRQAGFTLVELAVATVVLLFVVLLACELLTESGRLLHHSVVRAQDPWTLLAGELLRNDIRASAQPVPPPDIGRNVFTENGTPLVLGATTWGVTPRGELVRRPFAGNPHAYIKHVSSFRWRTLDGGAVEVWVKMRVSSTYLHALDGSMPHSDRGEDDDLHVLMVARGAGARQW